MPKKPWATDKQLEFMASQLPDYLDAQSKRDYLAFWPDLYQTWSA